MAKAKQAKKSAEAPAAEVQAPAGDTKKMTEKSKKGKVEKEPKSSKKSKKGKK